MNRNTYIERKNKGLCPICGQFASDGYVICEICRKNRRKKTESRRLLGLCFQCGKPTQRDVSLCDKCGRKQAEAKQKQRNQRKEEGLCIRCGAEIEPSYQNCKNCREYLKEMRKMYIQFGLCSGCHKEPVFGNERTCPECKVDRQVVNTKYRMAHRQEINERQNQRHRVNYQQRKEQGICTRCGKRKAADGKFTCKICRDKANSKYWKRLDKN